MYTLNRTIQNLLPIGKNTILTSLGVYSALIVSCSLFVTSGVSYAATRSVPQQYQTIQQAINSASNGDTVAIADGVYRENIEIVNKYITIRGNSDKQSVVLAGNPGKTPVMIQNVPYVAGGRMTLTGLKITGGYAPDGQGGGVTIANNADPEIYNNTIENNTALSHGGGILIFNQSHPLVRNNTIQKNTAKFFGGAIFAVKNSSPSIIDNNINGNNVTGGSITNGGPSGGGIYLENDVSNPSARSQPIVKGNILTSNTADFAGGGIMLRVGVDAIIESNTVTLNTAAYGGGVHVETEGSSPRIIANNISDNKASSAAQYAGSGYGGGISVYASSRPTVSNNTISNNQSTKGGAGISAAESAYVTVNSNSVVNNSVTGSGVVEGGGLYIANATGMIKNNIFRANSAQVGGGIAVLDNVTDVRIINNTIVKNNEPYSHGGAIFVRNSPTSHPTISNNVIDLNQGYQIFEESSKATIENNSITNTGTGIYYNYSSNGISTASSLNSSSKVDAVNNIDSLPMYIDGANDNYSLSSNSPAVNAGKTGFEIFEDIIGTIRADTPDMGAYEYSVSSNQKSPVYRFWSTAYNAHFYTIGSVERDLLLSTRLPSEWRYEGLSYGAFANPNADTVPLYRFYSGAYKSHFYTVDESERSHLISAYSDDVWAYEGIAYNVYPLSYNLQSQSVYRFWSPDYKHHFYTANDAESTYVTNNYPSNIWSFESQRYKVPRL